jgi:hypothetical protein
VSPKTLATVLEHCLDQQGTQLNSTSRIDDPSSESSLEDSQETVDRESEAVEDKAAETQASEENGKPTKKVLLVEDNHVNLKVQEL